MQSKIDTIQYLTDRRNLIDYNTTNSKCKDYISKTILTDNGLFITFQVGNKIGFDIDTYKYSTFKQQMKLIDRELYLEPGNKNCTRVDICFDTDTPFKDILKINNIIGLMYGKYINADVNDMIEVRKILDKQIQSLIINNSGHTKELQLYDKQNELGSSATGIKTRIEFRFKRLKSADIDKIMNDLYNLLPTLTIYFEEVEQQKLEYLYKLYVQELMEHKTKNFNMFVAKYQDDILTENILKGLYNKVFTNNNYRKWKYKFFRKWVKLNFIDKKQVKLILEQMADSLKKYFFS